MKHLKTLLTTIVVLLCSVTMNAHDFEVDGIYYNITSATDLTVAVIYKGSDHSSSVYSGDIVIPSSVSYNGNTYSVTSVGNYAFYKCSGVTNVSISNSVTSIGDYTFYGCSNLTSVTIGNSVTSIGDDAFRDCSCLTSITIPNSVTSIGDDAFRDCSCLTSITIPNSVTSIGNAFFNCTSLTSVHISDIAAWCKIKFGNYWSNPLFYAKHLFIAGKEITELVIPNGVTSIGDYAFASCSSLTSVTIPNSVTSIGSCAFNGCSGLTTVSIPNSVTSIGYSAFPETVISTENNIQYVDTWAVGVVDKNQISYTLRAGTIGLACRVLSGCINMQSVVLPNSLKYINEYSFYDCCDLNDINFPSNVTNIGESAFRGCTNLSTITIPKNVVSISFHAFRDCNSLVYVTINSNYFLSKNFSGTSDNNSRLAYIFGSQVKEYTIGDNVEKIGDYAFYDCDSLTTVKITSDLDSIGNSAFRNCAKLERVNIPSSVTYIGGYAFQGCTNLSSIAIPSSVTYIGGYAFSGCTSLSTITIPSSVKKIGDGAFSSCTNLSSIAIPSSVTNIGNYAFNYCTNLSSITIPSSVTNIGDYAFSGCTSLSSITIPSSVTNAFSGCTSLSSITILSSVTNIGKSAFSGCNSLVNVTINSNNFLSKNFTRYSDDNPILADIFGSQVKEYTIGGNVEKIGDYAFHDCDSLTTVKITSDLDSIGNSAFRNCAKLERVNIPSSVTNIGDYAFSGCTSLSTITIPSSVINIGSAAFTGCTSLSSIAIPTSVTNIGDQAFSDCTSLSAITIPENVVSIGVWAFLGCNSLVNVTINSNYFLSKNFTRISDNNPCLSYIFASQVKEYTIGGNVEKIGDYAFYDCDSLTTVKITSDLDSIGSSAFQDCRKLEFINIPDNVKYIGSQAFYGCEKLEEINIPDNVKYIGSDAFKYCTSLPVENNIRYAGTWAIGVTDITLPRYILRSNTSGLLGTFSRCSQMSGLTLPDSLRYIGDYAFNYCSKIKNLILPSRVNYIGAYAFASCTALKSVVSNNPVPPVCGEEAFYEVETANCSLEVPDSVVSLYSETAPWSDFNIVGVVIPTAMALVDGEAYDNKKELAMDSITYTRTFNNTNWQALYVPFAMNYEDWSADFDVAKINDIHQFDINGDGDFSDEGVDKTIMEMLIVNSGSLKPNHPYLIRAKAKGQKTITVKDAVLMPAQSKSIDCSSVEQKYVFTGTYNVIDGETMVSGKYYAMSGGSVKYTSSTANSLKPFRWYMQIQNRDGQVVQDVSEVKVVVRGEDDWDATGIDEIDTEENIYTIYSVDGRAIRCIKATTIEEATQGIASGMYIINGKKHFVK